MCTGGSHGPRGVRVSSYDPDDPNQGGITGGGGGGTNAGIGATTGTATARRPQRVATISQSHTHTEKTMLLSSDDEFQ